jgi:hypothetical protein
LEGNILTLGTFFGEWRLWTASIRGKLRLEGGNFESQEDFLTDRSLNRTGLSKASRTVHSLFGRKAGTGLTWLIKKTRSKNCSWLNYKDNFLKPSDISLLNPPTHVKEKMDQIKKNLKKSFFGRQPGLKELM